MEAAGWEVMVGVGIGLGLGAGTCFRGTQSHCKCLCILVHKQGGCHLKPRWEMRVAQLRTGEILDPEG